jgi:biopolymer transport protein TolR
MSMSTPGVNGTGGGRSLPTTLAEINVTPLVDVMLVLLIVFMISAPLMQQGVQVDLPKANAGTLNDVPDQVLLVVTKTRQVLINNNIIHPGTLRSKLEAMSAVKPDIQLFIQADEGVPYGFVAQVMAEAKQAKITRVGLVTIPDDSESRI